jgi:excisionase family DNA binding protein
MATERRKTTNKRITKSKRAKLTERGFGPDGGAWSITQASEWSGIGEFSLRAMAKAQTIPCLRVGRRFLIPREAFQEWFNGAGSNPKGGQ